MKFGKKVEKVPGVDAGKWLDKIFKRPPFHKKRLHDVRAKLNLTPAVTYREKHYAHKATKIPHKSERSKTNSNRSPSKSET